VIGGLCDKNQLKEASLKRAEKLGARAVRLPLDQFFPKNPKKGLNISQCRVKRL
jgi:hypothetical protein